MPTAPVSSIASSTARDERADLARLAAAHDVGDLVGEVVGGEDPGAHRVGEVVRDVRDPVGPGDHLALGRGRRGPAPRVVADPVERLDAQVERRQRDVGAVHGVVVPAGHVGREGLLRRVAGRAVAAVVRERDRLGERHVQAGDPGDPGGDLRDLHRVREAGAEVIVFGGDEHLALPREPAPRTRVLDAIEVALEAEAVRIGLLGPGARARADRHGSRPGRATASSACSRSSRRRTPRPTKPAASDVRPLDGAARSLPAHSEGTGEGETARSTRL